MQYYANMPQILRRNQVQILTGLSRSTIYALMKQRRFPLAVRISERTVGWIRSEIDEFLNSRISASRHQGEEHF